jgi:vacuolar protein sorting-associated protein 33A
LAELIKATTEEVSFREQWNTERAMIEGDTCYDLLEEWIYSGYPPYKMLRLLCLQSITSGGIKANRYDALRQAIVQVYGYEFLSVIHDLELCGWIKRKETLFLDAANRSLFHNIRRNLILIHAEVDTVEPDDVSYVSSGYAPLSVRLVQSAMQGWSDKEDVLRDVLLGGGGGGSAGVSGGNTGGGGSSASGASSSSLGRLLDIYQTYPPQDLSTTLKQQSPPIGAPLGVWAKKRATKPTLIVMYLGGITFMEIAALRFLSNRDSFPFHIIIVTTKILNGTKLLQEMG